MKGTHQMPLLAALGAVLSGCFSDRCELDTDTPPDLDGLRYTVDMRFGEVTEHGTLTVADDLATFNYVDPEHGPVRVTYRIVAGPDVVPTPAYSDSSR